MRNAIGLMSGTSLDGVDVAWLRTDGEQIESFGPTGYRPYNAEERAVLRAALDAAPRIVRREERRFSHAVWIKEGVAANGTLR